MYIGIDVGGTKTEIICLDLQGKELYRHRVASPQHHYLDTVNTIKRLVIDAEQRLSHQGSLGIGIPGSISSTTYTVKNANSVWLNGQSFKADIEAALGRPVRIENDANCFTLSEALDGAAKNDDVVFGAILGTGCGGGIVAHGELVSGINGLGGEWGHNPLPFPLVYSGESRDEDLNVNQKDVIDFFDQSRKTERSAIYHRKQEVHYFTDELAATEHPGPLCYCGKRGCLEKWISGRGLSDDYQRSTGDVKPAEAIVELVMIGDKIASDCVQRYYERLAKSVAEIINIIDPDVIVCGGGMSNVDTIYNEIPKRWDKYIFSDQNTTKFIPAKYGDSSGVRGAALLWK
ncbi:MAG: putative NBD/HSP70 family sugar kinase [Cellvibrionaceae bacterium]|jgi:predicted NBD/HSP70 family sugar kinase